ncbi:hypothetical protein BC937DRAFT_87870 [Endogone sp. FLAS-F59071]|nr:hypothetical protein BC937DRAFT_87870 [Endogone sp. FLAS-F59071]|eukprot:RUS12447.1 hypothetical protein BC937DRAFT_87870 [Endogone sp. FLAS-F59071]
MWMEFSRRFWKEGNRPIGGGCSETDLPVRITCYTDFGGDKAMLLASYTRGYETLQFSGYFGCFRLWVYPVTSLNSLLANASYRFPKPL